MRVLVTGGLGFVGRHVVTALAGAGHEVTVYDQDERIHHPQAAHHVYGDLLRYEGLADAIRGQDVVVHLAAHASVRGGNEAPSLDLEQNLLGTAHLLDVMQMADVKRMVFASSSAVYGNARVVPTPEDCVSTEQTSLYGASKLAAEALISAYCHTFGFQATVLRFVPMLGEGYHHGFVYDFWRKIKFDPTQIEVLGTGSQRKAYVYVGDAASAVALVMGRGGPPFEVFNVSGNITASVDESLDWICEEMGVAPERHYTGTSWSGDKAITWLDASKLRALGWVPSITPREAVIRTVRAFEASDDY